MTSLLRHLWCTSTLQPPIPALARPATFAFLRAASAVPAPYCQQRFYASKKGGKGGKDKGGSSSSDDAREVEPFNVAPTMKQMTGALERLKKDLGAMRLGRAHPGLLDSVMVTHKGSKLPLSQLAQITTKDAQTLMVIVNDEELVSAAEKSIRESDLGLNPQKEKQNAIKVAIPRMGPEYRETLVKQVAQLTEKARTQVRDFRADARNTLKKKYKGAASEDEMKRYEAMIQKETDRFVKEIDTVAEKKKKEIKDA
ncbi:hypothetical protein HK101_002621 [Irineochytrium annulatum]|nr:hypothetical protein HK101_002621 [Irineochytrium annulatum]